MAKMIYWTDSEVKSLVKTVEKSDSLSDGFRKHSENTGRTVEAIAYKYRSIRSRDQIAKRKYTRRNVDTVNASNGLKFDILNIKRAVLNGDNSLTLFF